MQSSTTPFRINFFKSLLTVWDKEISLRYWCRQCHTKHQTLVKFGDVYPQFICENCQTKNVINIKYQ